MFLHYLTLHRNRNVTLTSWSIDTWDRIPQGIIDKAIDHRQTRLRACVNAKGRNFEHLLWSSHTTGSFQSHPHAKSVLFITTHTIESDNINFPVLLRDAMHKCGLCRHAVSVCLCVCVSVCHVRELCQNE